MTDPFTDPQGLRFSSVCRLAEIIKLFLKGFDLIGHDHRTDVIPCRFQPISLFRQRI